MRVVGLVTSEKIKFLIFCTQLGNLRKQVVTGLNADGVGILTHVGLVPRRVLGHVCLGHAQPLGSRNVTVIGLAAHNPIEAIKGKVKRTDVSHGLHTIIGFSLTFHLVGRRIVHGLPNIARKPNAKAGNGVIV